MFFTHFLRDQVPPDDLVTHRFIEQMVPRLFEHYADTSAKGGDQSRNVLVNETTRHAFAAKADQSMVSHLLNGIFPTLHLLRALKEVGGVPLPSDKERCIYVLSYLMHDIDKILGHEALLHGYERPEQFETITREAIEHAKNLIADRLSALGADAFFPAYPTYLEDITYLVVNTQRRWNTHLPTYLWEGLELDERQLFPLRDLCTYSDKMAYLITEPSTILRHREGRKLGELLTKISHRKLEFSYHQLREVRGLFTNVVNTSVIYLFTHDREGNEREGVWPYLFFSDGVVYLKRKDLSLAFSLSDIVETVQGHLRQTCAEMIKQHAPGFKFSIQGIAKHPAYYYEFLSLEEYVALLARFTINRTKNDVTAAPLNKIRQMQAAGEIGTELPLAFPPEKRVLIGIMSRFLSVIFTTLLGGMGKKHQALREQMEQEIVQALELTSYWQQARAIPRKGGVEYRWFWLADRYLHDHPGLDISGNERSLETIFTSICTFLIIKAGEALKEQLPQQYLIHLSPYLDSIVELPPSIRAESSFPNVSGELERYLRAKGQKRKLVCTVCNSAYPTEEQNDNAVLFQPWVYKNKIALYAGKNAGGMCAICALEFMLRQILLKGQLRLTGSSFEALKTKYLAVYPNFFFTPETGALVSGILDQLQDINFFTVRKQLAGAEISISALWELDAFAAPIASETQVVDLDEEEDEEEQEVSVQVPDRSYVKYHPERFPGIFLFGMRAGKDENDTASWAMPAFLALTLPLVTSTKIVVSEMSLPLFHSGRDFHETVIFDAPHPYLSWLLQGKRVRVNQLLRTVRRLVSIYRVNIDTYAKNGRPEWGHLSTIARELETDPLFLFSYLRRQERIESKYKSDVGVYLHIFTQILEADVSKIEHCVKNYITFYHGSYQSHSILKPVDIVAKAIITSPLSIEEEDLLWQIRGELKNWLDRVRSRQATGWAMFYGRDIPEKEAPAIETFVRGFYQEVFLEYCQGERGLLRSRINRFKDGCEAYYIDQLRLKKIQEQETEEEAATRSSIDQRVDRPAQ
jgi:CRISPR-associated protein Csc3